MRKLVPLIALAALALFTGSSSAALTTTPMKLDPTFGTGGRTVTDFAGPVHEDEPFTIIELPDGKYVLPGKAYNAATGNYDFIVLRYNQNGSLDTTFDADGKATVDIMGGYDEALAVAHDHSTGKLVVAGWGRNPANGIEDMAVARLNANGSIDSTFGAGGVAVVDFAGGNDRAYGVAVLSTGTIVAGGFATSASGDNDFALIGLNPDGSLNPSFGTAGKVTTDFGGAMDAMTRMIIQSDEKIVGVGVTANPSTSSQDFAFARYNPDGSIDAPFASGGKGTIDFFGTTDFALTVFQQPDARLLVGGIVLNPFTSHHDFGLARLNVNGSLDLNFATYGQAGLVTTDFFGNYDQILALAVQPDGKIIAAGHAKHPQRSFEFALARYNPDGTMDNTFGIGGRLTTDWFGGPDGIHGIVLDSKGRAVVGGDGLNPATDGDDFIIARYLVADPSWMAAVALKLAVSAFGPGNARAAVLFSIYYAQADISNGNLAGAIDKLKVLRDHLAGCGATAGPDDWIIDCAAQVNMRTLTNQVIYKLGGSASP